MPKTVEYSISELRILWYLKEHGPMVAESAAPQHSLYNRLSRELYLRKKTVSYSMRTLQGKCVVLVTYKRPNASKTFADGGGYNAVLRVELVDPNMTLPPQPGPMPLANVVKYENEELYERTEQEPTIDQMFMALLDRNNDLQKQVDVLRERLIEVGNENEELKKKVAKPPNRLSPHLTTQVRDTLPPEVWESLTHGSRKR